MSRRGAEFAEVALEASGLDSNAVASAYSASLRAINNNIKHLLRMEINDITKEIISAAIEVHKHLGPGLLEKVYERALVYELTLRGFGAVPQLPVPIFYKGVDLTADDDKPLRLDILVDDTIIVELKSVDEMKPLYGKQLLTYLKLMNKQVGLLINFNVPRLVDGVERVVNRYKD